MLTPIQRLAVLSSVDKALKSQTKQARVESDEYLKDLYENTGSDRVKIKLGGQEVGALSLVFSKDEYVIKDEEAFNDFILANGFASERKSIDPTYLVEVIARIEDDLPEAVITGIDVSSDFSKMIKRVGDSFVIDGTNEVIPGIEPKPITIKNTRLAGCKPEDVIPIVRDLPGSIDAFLLGDGNE